MKAALATFKDYIFPTRSSEHWWITARSPFARMRAVLSESKPQGEQNPMRLCDAVTMRQNAQV